MKKFFVIILAVTFLISCSTTKKSSGNNDTTEKITEKNTANMNGTWQLQMLFASDNTWAKTPFLNINLTDKTFSGNSGCNSIRGRFTVNENYFGFDKNIASTKMACTDPNSNRNEQTFLSALLKINTYTLTKDELELRQGEIVLMKFKRSPL